MAGAIGVGGIGLLVLSASSNWIVYVVAFPDRLDQHGRPVAAVATATRSLQSTGASQASAVHDLLHFIGLAMVVLTAALLVLHRGVARLTARSAITALGDVTTPT